MPFNRCNLGSEQGLIDDPVLGQGRDPLAPLQDVINDEGDIVVPVDPRYLGLWLTGLFGDPDMTDSLDGSWDHEFASGGDHLPSYTIEIGMPKVPAFFVHAGVKLNSIALEFTRWGPGLRRSGYRSGRDPVRHDSERHADQPHLQPHQPVPGLDQAHRQPGWLGSVLKLDCRSTNCPTSRPRASGMASIRPSSFANSRSGM
jgi:hypothetical protein